MEVAMSASDHSDRRRRVEGAERRAERGRAYLQALASLLDAEILATERNRPDESETLRAARDLIRGRAMSVAAILDD
jgi:hypothetical protein